LALMGIRAHVRVVAAVWLTCQVTALAAAPFVLCNEYSVMTQMADRHDCDPMQHHHDGQTTDSASLNCRCTVSDAALAAMLLDTGILPGELVLETRLVDVPVIITDHSAPTQSHIPDTPPPRA
jgi:hypothetical protein